jgi:threonine dehydrogenase-like Zn-dependent dehydrogenase
MAAQVARIAGFDVTVCDPDPVRLKMARDHGLSQAAAGLSEPGLCDNFALVLECSGGKRTTTYTLFSNFFSNVMSRSAAVGSIVIWIKATSGIRTARGRVWIVACAGWRKGVSRLAVSPGPFRQKWARKYT